jgi:hypothetical protein
MEFTPEALEVDGLTFTYCTHEGERHWTLNELALIRVPLRTNQLDPSDILDTRPKMVREGALETWATTTTSASGERLLVWLGSVRAALESVEAAGAVEGLRRCSTTETIKAREERATEQQELGYTTIEWKNFAYRGEDASGISLRAMVEAGLYARMDHAVRALEASSLKHKQVSLASPQNGGHARQDYILALPDAQFFAATARTDMGERIARLIIEHHADFQRLLAGDEEVAEKVRKHQGAAASLDQDPVLSQLEALKQNRLAILEQNRRLEQLEQRAKRYEAQSEKHALLVEAIAESLDQSLKPGERSAESLARMAGWKTKSGNFHAGAVHLIRKLENCQLGEHYRLQKHWDEMSGQVVDTHVYLPAFVTNFREAWREQYQNGAREFYIANPHGPGAHVHATKFLHQGREQAEVGQ